MQASSTRYTIFSLLFLIALINYVDRGALSLLLTPSPKSFISAKSNWARC